MAKAKDEKIPNISEPWEGYAGSRVEEFIKEQFGSKFGYMNLRFIDSENMYHIESFASEADFLLYEEVFFQIPAYGIYIWLYRKLLRICFFFPLPWKKESGLFYPDL